ncbi:hypothetical protein SDC9_147074 [bioreactor metagenome]|uniref:Uncharacterized protein n=1 Tax=bioreactor metagenome TaxID=1076179 RepID=A0A645EEW9_9ZZZZ
MLRVLPLQTVTLLLFYRLITVKCLPLGSAEHRKARAMLSFGWPKEQTISGVNPSESVPKKMLPTGIRCFSKKRTALFAYILKLVSPLSWCGKLSLFIHMTTAPLGQQPKNLSKATAQAAEALSKTNRSIFQTVKFSHRPPMSQNRNGMLL